MAACAVFVQMTMNVLLLRREYRRKLAFAPRAATVEAAAG
jgi:hypothetical protein